MSGKILKFEGDENGQIRLGDDNDFPRPLRERDKDFLNAKHGADKASNTLQLIDGAIEDAKEEKKRRISDLEEELKYLKEWDDIVAHFKAHHDILLALEEARVLSLESPGMIAVVWIYHPVDKGPWLKTGTLSEANDCEALCINKGHFIEVARYLNGGKM